MSRAVRTITLLAVLLHMLFGCCLHHAHLFGGQAESSRAKAAHSCPCHHHGHEPAEQPADDRSGRHDCGGSKCVFIRPELTDSSELLPGFDGLVSTEVAADTTGPSVIERINAVDFHAGPSMGLHLLNQALLL